MNKGPREHHIVTVCGSGVYRSRKLAKYVEGALKGGQFKVYMPLESPENIIKRNVKEVAELGNAEVQIHATALDKTRSNRLSLDHLKNADLIVVTRGYKDKPDKVFDRLKDEPDSVFDPHELEEAKRLIKEHIDRGSLVVDSIENPKIVYNRAELIKRLKEK